MVSSALRIEGVTPSTAGMASIIALRGAQEDETGIVMPVRPAQAIYASFRHIQVLPDTRLQDGVPLYKLRILDSLIDRVTSTGARGKGATPAFSAGLGRAAPRDEGRVDSLIIDLSKGLRAADRAATREPGSSSYRAGFLPLPGAFVDLVA
jgi:hypothetical protein